MVALLKPHKLVNHLKAIHVGVHMYLDMLANWESREQSNNCNMYTYLTNPTYLKDFSAVKNAKVYFFNLGYFNHGFIIYN